MLKKYIATSVISKEKVNMASLIPDNGCLPLLVYHSDRASVL